MTIKSPSQDERIDIRVLEDCDKIRLNNCARDTFLDALSNPPVPGDALRRAAVKHTMR